MEPNESQQHHHHHLSSYFTSTTSSASSTIPTSTTPAPTNGLLPPPNSAPDSGGGHHMVYPHSVGPSSAAVSTASMEPPRRKRGRPRKYGTPEQALAAKKTPPSSSNSFPRDKREAASSSPSYSGSSRKSQQLAFGNAGHGFTPHVITVTAGEDVHQKIMLFLTQSKREMCILSASGMVSNASLRQPATSGGSVNYEGRFEIVSLTGSYVSNGNGGRTGGLSLCLSNANGNIIGGGVVGQVIAGGPVQFDNKKDGGTGAKADASAGKLPSPLGGSSMSNIGFRPPGESSGRNPVRGNDDHLNIGGSFMTHPLDMHAAPSRSTDWRSGSAGYEFTGRTGHGGNHSPENGDYEQLPD